MGLPLWKALQFGPTGMKSNEGTSKLINCNIFHLKVNCEAEVSYLSPEG